MVEKLTKEIDGRVVSSLQLYFVELPSRRLAVIEEVFTAEEHRGRGYATELIKRAIERARSLEADCVELTVRQDAPHIKEFYERLGFEDRMQTAMRLKFGNFNSWKP